MPRFLSVAILLLLAGLVLPAQAAEPIVIRFAHVVTEDSPKGQMALRFKEEAERRLPGRVRVEIYPNSTLLDDEHVLEALLLGRVQLAAPALSKFGRYTRQLELFDLPFLFKDRRAVVRFQQGASGQQLLHSLQDKGLYGLGYLQNGMKQISANRPLRVPQDARRLKFRIMPSDVLEAQFNTLGAIPIRAPFSEVYPLLQSGALDGQENTWSNIYTKKLHTVQRYITETNHGPITYMLVTSNAFWQGLPEEMRNELQKALNNAIAYGNQRAEALDNEYREAIRNSGDSRILLPYPNEQEYWVQTMQPVWKRFEARIGKDLIQAALQANTTN